ncbi:MAG: hypothetical protein H7X97_12495 [Opitutaceae bacterium]|nr:hypothetical protein [Verrucomicrobiales bacterium]
MSFSADNMRMVASNEPILLEVSLDGEPVVMPPTQLLSWPEIVDCLKQRALASERVLSVLLVDGVVRTGDEEILSGTPPKSVLAISVTFQELGGETIRIAREQVRRLAKQLEAAQLLILINDWRVAEQLWWELMPDLRAPLLELNFLWELGGARLLPSPQSGVSLSELAERLGHIQAQVEIQLRQRGDVVGLVTSLEENLGQWIRQLDGLLDSLHEIYHT